MEEQCISINVNLKIENIIKKSMQFEHVRNNACFLICNTKYAITYAKYRNTKIE